MLATLFGFGVRLWTAAGDPDNSVISSSSATPDFGEWYINSTNNTIFLCTGNTYGSQIWIPGTNSAVIATLISSNRSQSSASRSLNSAFQVSSTRWSTVRYSVDISTTVSLTGGAVGRVILETATNSGFTTGVQELQSFGNGNTGTLVVGLVLTQSATACLSGDVPPGNYVRLRTVNITGTPTFNYISGQEVLL
jgi:hypothetical protein